MTWNLPDSLIQLKDDNIIDIMIYDSESRMCDTCDYGRTYMDGLREPGVSTPG